VRRRQRRRRREQRQAGAIRGGSRVETGNAARCVEVGLVSTWKIDETGSVILAKQASKDVHGVARGNFTRGLPPRGKGREPDGETSFQTRP